MGEIKVLLQTNDNLCESDVFIFALFIKAFRELYKDETYKFYMSEGLMANLVNFDVVNNQDFMLEKELLEPANITLSQGSIILPNKKFDKLSEISLNLESDTLTGVAIRSGNPIKQSSYFLRCSSEEDVRWLYVLNFAHLKSKCNQPVVDTKHAKFWFSKSIFLQGPKTIAVRHIVSNPDEADYFVFYSDQVGALILDKYPELINHKTCEIKKPILTMEGGFLANITLFKLENPPEINARFAMPMSYNLSTRSHYDISTPYLNTLEYLLTEGFEPLKNKQIKRAQDCIKKIKEYKLSKYNCQFSENSLFENKKTAIIIDQAYNDKSISMSNASAKTFEEMLDYAIGHTPQDWNLFIKVHPEQLCGRRQGYFTNNKEALLSGQIFIPENCRAKFLATPDWNPVDMLMHTDKIYTVGSQMGFEALMCDTEVVTFGVPFYAGYGLTKDMNNSERLLFRNKYIHSLEEIFYITYIKYTHYFETFSNDRYCKVEIETCIENLRNKVNEFKTMKGVMR